MPAKYDLPIGAIGLLLSIRNGLPVYTVQGIVAVHVRGKWYKSNSSDVDELERHRYIVIDDKVRLTKLGADKAKRYAHRAARGLIDLTPPAEETMLEPVEAAAITMERA